MAKDPDHKLLPPGVGRVLGVIAASIVLALIGVAAQYTTNRADDERAAVRDRGANACAALSEDSGLSEVTEARNAFEDDRQLVLGVAARRVESALRAGTAQPASVGELAARCRETYGP